MGQKHKRFREFRTPFPPRVTSTEILAACTRGAAYVGAICSKNRKLVLKSRNGVRFGSPSPIIAPVTLHWNLYLAATLGTLTSVPLRLLPVALWPCAKWFKALTRFLSYPHAPMTLAGHWYAYTSGRLEILWRHKEANEEKQRLHSSCFLRWNFAKVCILTDYFTIGERVRFLFTSCVK